MVDSEFEHLDEAVREITHDIPARLLLGMSRDGKETHIVCTKAELDDFDIDYYRIAISPNEITVWQQRHFFYCEQVRRRTVRVAQKTFGGALNLYHDSHGSSFGSLRSNDLTQSRAETGPHGGLRPAAKPEEYINHHP